MEQQNQNQKPHSSANNHRLVLFPLPAQGHINPMLQLAYILHSRGFSITIIHTRFNSPDKSKHPHFTFLPISDGVPTEKPMEDIVFFLDQLNSNCVAPFRDCLAGLLADGPISCLITDALFLFPQSVADGFGIPTIVLRTTSIFSFLVYAAMPMLREKGYFSNQEYVNLLRASTSGSPSFSLLQKCCSLGWKSNCSLLVRRTLPHAGTCPPSEPPIPLVHVAVAVRILRSDGFVVPELISSLASVLIDVLWRGGTDVTVASVENQLCVDACHGMKIVADALISECSDTVYDLISLHLLVCYEFFGYFSRVSQELQVRESIDSQLESPVPEVAPLQVKDLPSIRTADPENMHKLLINVVQHAKASLGLIWNTFSELEESALTQSREQFGIPIFPIGPFHKSFPASSSSLLVEDRSSISWLNTQKPKSVLYVSFGSVADMHGNEFLEMAWGLANSMQPFLWVVRPGLVRGLETLEALPSGFMETIGNRGCIIKWAPQQEVLAHFAVGGFWTHNGWNSTLESIGEGVPMICSPFFGDQMANAKYVTDIWRIGLRFDKGVERGEVERGIKRLMVKREGEEMRKRSLCLKEKADSCLKEGGSSYQSLEQLISHILSFQ